MSNVEHIPSKHRPPGAPRSPLDHARPSPTVPRVTIDATAPPAPMSDAERTKLLAAHPWKLAQKQLTAIAFKRIRARSLKDAEDIAQAAIVDAYESPENGGWDPAKGPLMGFLVGRTVSGAQNERRRKRNVCEVWVDEEIEEGEDEGVSRHEKYLGADAPPSDEVLHRLRFAHTVVERALARLAGDALALGLAPHLKEGVSSIDDLARLTVRPKSEVWAAKRRVRYHVDEIMKELSATAEAPRAGSVRGATEVTQ
jgi:DNA-directed RNA polymerase specialized sigma24 family protein